MSCCISSLKNKEVVNICDGRRLGCIVDLEIDVRAGKLLSIVVPGDCKLISFKSCDICIPWEQIEHIGNDTILVKLPFYESKKQGIRRR